MRGVEKVFGHAGCPRACGGSVPGHELGCEKGQNTIAHLALSGTRSDHRLDSPVERGILEAQCHIAGSLETGKTI